MWKNNLPAAQCLMIVKTPIKTAIFIISYKIPDSVKNE